MTRKEVEIYAVEHGLELPVLTDGDDAIVGVVCEGGAPRVVYSKGRFIAALQVGGMTEEEALEWFDYNTAHSLPYMGENHPVFVEP